MPSEIAQPHALENARRGGGIAAGVAMIAPSIVARSPLEQRLRLIRSAQHIALGLLVSSLCFSGLALAKDNGDDEDGAAPAKPALPNVYLDMRTIYTTLPAGVLSIGFSTPPLLSTLSNLSSQSTLSSLASRSIAVDLPVTVDVNDWLSVYGGVSGGASQSGTDSWTAFSVYSFTVGFQADVYQQNGGMFPTITVQSNATRSISDAPLATTAYNTILEADYALNADETRGVLAGVQYTRVLVDTAFARSSPTSWDMPAATINGTTTGNLRAGSACSPSAAPSC